MVAEVVVDLPDEFGAIVAVVAELVLGVVGGADVVLVFEAMGLVIYATYPDDAGIAAVAEIVDVGEDDASDCLEHLESLWRLDDHAAMADKGMVGVHHDGVEPGAEDDVSLAILVVALADVGTGYVSDDEGDDEEDGGE